MGWLEQYLFLVQDLVLGSYRVTYLFELSTTGTVYKNSLFNLSKQWSSSRDVILLKNHFTLDIKHSLVLVSQTAD